MTKFIVVSLVLAGCGRSPSDICRSEMEIECRKMAGCFPDGGFPLTPPGGCLSSHLMAGGVLQCDRTDYDTNPCDRQGFHWDLASALACERGYQALTCEQERMGPFPPECQTVCKPN